ncbi:MAG: ATP-grasp domain-containing protein [Pseudomonadota bacterium]
MKIAIIHDEIHPLINQVVSGLAEKNIEVHLLLWNDFKYQCSDGVIEIFNKDQNLCGFDKIFLERAGEESPSYYTQLRLLKIAQSMGCKIFNDPYAYERARDKASATLILSKNLLPVPPTILVHNIEEIQDFISLHKDVICKPILGHSGIGILPFSEKNIPFDKLQELLVKDGVMLLQKYIKGHYQRDVRVDVVNGKIAQCYYRYANDISQFHGDYVVCNVARGGRPAFIDAPSDARKLALAAAKCLDLVVAGVDFIENENGELFISEVNPEPNMPGTEGVAFPKAISNFLSIPFIEEEN